MGGNNKASTQAGKCDTASRDILSQSLVKFIESVIHSSYLTISASNVIRTAARPPMHR